MVLQIAAKKYITGLMELVEFLLHIQKSNLRTGCKAIGFCKVTDIVFQFSVVPFFEYLGEN